MACHWLISPATLVLLAATSQLHVRAHTDADGYELFTRVGAPGTPLNSYKLHPERATWDSASVACVREGAHLLVIESADEATLARTLFHRLPAPPPKLLDQVHVGLTDKGHEGVWKTVLGAELASLASHVPWAPGQPDNAGADEHCGAITRDIFYNDLPCDKTYSCPFICEKELPARGLEVVDRGVSLAELIGETGGAQGDKSRFLAILLKL